MRKKELQEQRKKTAGDRETHLNELKRKLVGLKLELAQGKIKNVAEIRKIKRTIAKLLTIEEESKKP